MTFERISGEIPRDVGQYHYKLQCTRSNSDVAPRSLDRAHHKLPSRAARKTMVYQEKVTPHKTYMPVRQT